MARSTELEEEVLDQVVTDDVASPAPSYVMAEGMSIPVPKNFGKLWYERIKSAKEVYQMEHLKWDAVFDQYRRCGDEGIRTDSGETYQYHHKENTDENIIRTNIRTIMRSTYMKNPHLEFTGSDEDDDFADTLEYIITYLMNKQTHPGINLKPKARRWIMHGQLTNFGVLRLDYQAKEGSLEEAQKELEEIEEKLRNSKDKDEIQQNEQRLQLLYEKMPLLESKGMLLSNVLPHKVIVDPNTTQIDLSDCGWLAEEFPLDRDYVREKYYVKKGDDYAYRANPEKTIKPREKGDADVEESVLSTVLNDQTQQRRDYVKKNKVMCWMIYDKTTRRNYLFSSEDWSQPLWVYEDDLKLSRFFRHFIISFSESLDGIVQPGEASFYIGQVHAINEINRKAQQIRKSVFGALMYDKESADADEVKKLIAHLNNPSQVAAFGISKKGSEKKISEMLEVFVPPSFEYQQLFDTRAFRSVIDKAQAMSDVDRGEQFKANTTNDAVQYMAGNRQAATNQLIDLIEDSFEALGWAMSEILVSKYTKDDITELVGPEKAAKFTPMTVREFNRTYRMTIAAGSIEKPTTEYKKEEAIKISQSIGQFGQAAPGTTMRLMLRMFQNAFSSFLVKKKDWDQLEAETQANLTKGVSTNAGQNQQ